MSARCDDPPFCVGERVDGTSWVCPDQLDTDCPETFECAEGLQAGSGYANVDADAAYVWVRLADRTERQARVQDARRTLQAGAVR